MTAHIIQQDIDNQQIKTFSFIPHMADFVPIDMTVVNMGVPGCCFELLTATATHFIKSLQYFKYLLIPFASKVELDISGFLKLLVEFWSIVDFYNLFAAFPMAQILESYV